MFRSVFKPYGLVWNFCNTITDVLGLSILWAVCCLPVFTIGAATTALYDAAAHGIRNREAVVYRRFLRTFRRELKTGAAVTLLWGAILLFGGYVLALLMEAGTQDSRASILSGAYRMLLLLPLTAACWSAAILSRFDYGFRGLIGMALRFLPAHLPASLFLGVLTWLAAWYCLKYPIGLTFAPATLVLGWSLVVEPVFRKYGGGLVPQTEERNQD